MKKLNKILKSINNIPKQKDDEQKLKKANDLLEYVSNISIDIIDPLFDDILGTIDEYIQNIDQLNMSNENNKEEMIDILDDIADEIAGWIVDDWDDYEEDDDDWWDDDWDYWDRRRYYDIEKDDYYEDDY